MNGFKKVVLFLKVKVSVAEKNFVEPFKYKNMNEKVIKMERNMLRLEQYSCC